MYLARKYVYAVIPPEIRKLPTWSIHQLHAIMCKMSLKKINHLYPGPSVYNDNFLGSFEMKNKTLFYHGILPGRYYYTGKKPSLLGKLKGDRVKIYL